MPHALVVEPDEGRRSALVEVAQGQGFSTTCASSLHDAQEQMRCGRADVVLVDVPVSDGDGRALLHEIRSRPRVEVVVMTRGRSEGPLPPSATEGGDLDTARGGLRGGNGDKSSEAPVVPEQVVGRTDESLDLGRVRAVLSKVAREHGVRESDGAIGGEPQGAEMAPTDAAGGEGLASAADEIPGEIAAESVDATGPLLGRSSAIREVERLVARVAPTNATVLIYGESGTGKELVAQAIHERSHRAGRILVALNCGAIPENLIESELFGHQKGAFTGASGTRRGVFERAAGGTLFLDEIVEMPLDLQVRLLRVLETGRLVRVGGEEEIRVDVRVIAATNRDPARATVEGALREDLFYRLAVFPMRLPPLRERGDDVVLLADHFLAELNAGAAVARRLSAEARARVATYPWPGNVRQLRNAIQRAFILSDSEIGADLLPPPEEGGVVGEGPQSRVPHGTAESVAGAVAAGVAVDGAAVAGDEPAALRVTVGTSIAQAEARLILATLAHYGGDKNRAARTLGISLKTLYNRLNEYQQTRDPALRPVTRERPPAAA